MQPQVLVVDDDQLIRTMVRDALSDVPCEIHEADSGDAALSIVSRDQPPAVVLLDLMMPGKSGLDVLTRIAERSRVLVMSALDTEALVQQALKAGAHGFLAKPIHPLDVQNLVRAALEETGRKT